MNATARGESGDLGSELARHGRPTVLDMSDDRQYRYVRERWEASGRSRERQPHLFHSLERTRAIHKRDRGPRRLGDDPDPITTVTGIGFDRDHTGGLHAVGSAVYSANGGKDYTGLTLQLADQETGQPIGDPSTIDDFAAGVYEPIQASGTVVSDSRALNAVFQTTDSVSPTLVEQGAAPLRLVAQHVQFTEVPAAPPVSSAPVRKPNRTVDYTMVCLRRPMGDIADCDYGPFGTAPVVVPVSGKIVYASRIQAFTSENSSASLYLVSRKVGGGPQFHVAGAAMSAFSIDSGDPSGRTLVWNWKPGQFAAANPFLTYEYIDIVLCFGITTQTSRPNMVYAFVSSAVNTVAGPNTEKLAPLQFADGCLAAGTPVALAGGGTRPVEALSPGDRILGRDGPLTVRTLCSGPEPNPVIRIRTDGEFQLVVSEAHPVIGTAGVLIADELKLGDLVLTHDGPKRITELERRPCADLVWNLKLGTPDELARAGSQHGTFYAGGVLVGDATLQGEANQARGERKPEDVLLTLPREWRDDYLSVTC